MSSEVYQDEAIVLRVKSGRLRISSQSAFVVNTGKSRLLPTGRPTPGTRAGGWCSPLPICRFPFCPGGVLLPCGAARKPGQPAKWIGKGWPTGPLSGETAESLLGDEEPQKEIFQLLVDAYRLLPKRNKRLVTDSTLLKLLALCGLQPILDNFPAAMNRLPRTAFSAWSRAAFCAKTVPWGRSGPCPWGPGT